MCDVLLRDVFLLRAIFRAWLSPSPHRHIGNSCVSGSEGGTSPECLSLSRLAAPPQDSYPLCCGSFLANLLAISM